MKDKRLILWGLAINYALGYKSRADALDTITDEREKKGESPNTKEADAFFDAVWNIAEMKATTDEKKEKIRGLIRTYKEKI